MKAVIHGQINSGIKLEQKATRHAFTVIVSSICFDIETWFNVRMFRDFVCRNHFLSPQMIWSAEHLIF